MGVGLEPKIDFWLDVKKEWGAEEALSIYKEAFPDKSEFYNSIQQQYGSDEAFDILYEVMRQSIPEPTKAVEKPAVEPEAIAEPERRDGGLWEHLKKHTLLGAAIEQAKASRQVGIRGTQEITEHVTGPLVREAIKPAPSYLPRTEEIKELLESGKVSESLQARMLMLGTTRESVDNPNIVLNRIATLGLMPDADEMGSDYLVELVNKKPKKRQQQYANLLMKLFADPSASAVRQGEEVPGRRTRTEFAARHPALAIPALAGEALVEDTAALLTDPQRLFDTAAAVVIGHYFVAPVATKGMEALIAKSPLAKRIFTTDLTAAFKKWLRYKKMPASQEAVSEFLLNLQQPDLSKHIVIEGVPRDSQIMKEWLRQVSQYAANLPDDELAYISKQMLIPIKKTGQFKVLTPRGFKIPPPSAATQIGAVSPVLKPPPEPVDLTGIPKATVDGLQKAGMADKAIAEAFPKTTYISPTAKVRPAVATYMALPAAKVAKAPITKAKVAPVIDNVDRTTVETVLAQRVAGTITDEEAAKSLAAGAPEPAQVERAVAEHGAEGVLDEIEKEIATPAEPEHGKVLRDWMAEKRRQAAERMRQEEGFFRPGQILEKFKRKPPEPLTEEEQLEAAFKAGEERAGTDFKEAMKSLGRGVRSTVEVATGAFEPELTRQLPQAADDFRTGYIPIISRAKDKTLEAFHYIWGDDALVPMSEVNNYLQGQTAEAGRPRPPELLWRKAKEIQKDVADKRRQRVRLKIFLEDLRQGMYEGLPLPRNLQDIIAVSPEGNYDHAILLELERLNEDLTAPELQAYEDYKEYATLVGQDLVQRGDLSEGSLKDLYLPHRIVDYTPEWAKNAPFAAKKLTEPFAYYTFKRRGSVRDIDMSEDMFYYVFSTIEANNMLNDFAVGPKGILPKNDIVPNLTDDEKKVLFGDSMKPRASSGRADLTGRYEIGDEIYKGFRYQPRRSTYMGVIADPVMLFDAIDQLAEVDIAAREYIRGLPPEERYDAVMEYMSDVGPRGGAALRIGRIVGPYSKVFVIPEVLHDKLIKMKETGTPIPGFYNIPKSMRIWKRGVLGPFGAGLQHQALQIVSDPFQAFRTAPEALNPANVWNAWQVLRNYRPEHQSALTPFQLDMLRVAEEKDIFSSGYFNEFTDIYGVSHRTPIGDFLKMYERASSARELILRLSMLSAQVKKIRAGKPLRAPEYKHIIEKMDPESAAAYITRNFGADYQAVPDYWRRYVSGALGPFATWPMKNLRNWALLARYAPFIFAANVALRVMLEARNREEHPDVSEMLPTYLHERTKVIWKTERDEEGIPIGALVQTIDDPLNEAISVMGLHKLPMYVQFVREGLMDPETAVQSQFFDVLKGPYKLYEELRGPLVAVVQGLAQNKHHFTKGPIVPKQLQGASAMEKLPYQAAYFIESLATPVGTFMNNVSQPDRVLNVFPEIDELSPALENYVKKGPGDFLGGMGFRVHDLTLGDVRDMAYMARRARSDSNIAMFKLEQAFLRSDGDLEEFIKSSYTQTAIEDAIGKGIAIKSEDIRNLMMKPRVQLELTLNLLRKETDEAKRKELEKRRNVNLSAVTYELLKGLPKRAHANMILRLSKWYRAKTGEDITIMPTEEMALPVEDLEIER